MPSFWEPPSTVNRPVQTIAIRGPSGSERPTPARWVAGPRLTSPDGGAGDLAALGIWGGTGPGGAHDAAEQGADSRFGGRRDGELRAVRIWKGNDDGNHPCCPPS